MERRTAVCIATYTVKHGVYFNMLYRRRLTKTRGYDIIRLTHIFISKKSLK